MTRETDPRVLDSSPTACAQGAPQRARPHARRPPRPARKAPAAFAWLAERAADDEALRARNPLRLLQQILAAMTRDEFAPYRLRLLALAESGGTVPRLLAHLTEDQAAQADDAMQRAPGSRPSSASRS